MIDSKADYDMNIDKCKKICDKNDKCKFIFFAKRKTNKFACITYRACDTFRDASNAGSIYSKEEKCPGTQKIKDFELWANKKASSKIPQYANWF